MAKPLAHGTTKPWTKLNYEVRMMMRATQRQHTWRHVGLVLLAAVLLLAWMYAATHHAAGQTGSAPTAESPLNQTADADRTKVALQATQDMQTARAVTPQPQPTVDIDPTLTAWANRPRIWPTPVYIHPTRPLGTGILVEGGSLQDPNLPVKTLWNVVTADNLNLLVFTGAMLDGGVQESVAPGFVRVEVLRLGNEGPELACCGDLYRAPTGSGPLRIVDVNDMTLKLQTTGGETVYFDVRLRQFLDAAGIPIVSTPTLLPTPTGLPYPGPVEVPTATAPVDLTPPVLP